VFGFTNELTPQQFVIISALARTFSISLSLFKPPTIANIRNRVTGSVSLKITRAVIKF
jgi:hypothetical protein